MANGKKGSKLMFKLTPISNQEIIEEAYTDYCDGVKTPLNQDAWIKTDEAKQSIKLFKVMLGITEGAK